MCADMMRLEELVSAWRTVKGKSVTDVLSRWFRLVGMTEEVLVGGATEDGWPATNVQQTEHGLGGGVGRTDCVVLGLGDGCHGSWSWRVLSLFMQVSGLCCGGSVRGVSLMAVLLSRLG